MGIEATENPSKCGAQNGKAKSPRARLIGKLARVVRKAGLDLRRLALRRPEGSAEVRTQTGGQAEEATPCPDRRPVPGVLQGRGRRRGRAARPDAAAAVLHRRQGQRTVRHRGRRRGLGELQDLRQPGQGERRTGTSSSASPSPRPSAPTSPPTRRTAGCSRPGVAASSARGGWSRS